MSAPFTNYGSQSPSIPPSSPATFTSVFNPATFNLDSQPSTPSPASRGRGRGGQTGGAKRGRKPRGGAAGGSPRATFVTPSGSGSGTSTPTTFASANSGGTYQKVHWAVPATGGEGSSAAEGASRSASTERNLLATASTSQTPALAIDPTLAALSAIRSSVPGSSVPSTPRLDAVLNLARAASQQPQGSRIIGPGGEEDGEGDDELLPAMADDDYSAQLSWQSQSKDNLKVLMENFSPAQYDRFEAYRRHALPKQAVRKVVQQSLGHQVSQPVAQIIAGFSKVFIGEIVETARAVQKRRGEMGPLSPDHLREAYRIYQAQTGRVGAARPLRSKKLFVR